MMTPKRNDRSNKVYRLTGLLGMLVLFLSAACGPELRIGSPFEIDRMPDESKREPLSFAIVRPNNPVRNLSAEGRDVDAKVRSALSEGLADATRCIARSAVVVDVVPAQGYDVIVIPANIYFETDRGGAADISMDVTLIRLRDGKQFGLLVEGHAAPGPRPLAAFEGRRIRLRAMGSTLANDRFGQAINNVLFQTCYDYLDKLDRRMPSLLDE